MAEFKVPVAYVQHAEVTPYFPSPWISTSAFCATRCLATSTRQWVRLPATFILLPAGKAMRWIAFAKRCQIQSSASTRRLGSTLLLSNLRRLRCPTIRRSGVLMKLHPNASTSLTDEEAASLQVLLPDPGDPPCGAGRHLIGCERAACCRQSGLPSFLFSISCSHRLLRWLLSELRFGSGESR